MARLDGVQTLVTGGTSGIGAAIVDRLQNEGASVVFTGRDVARGAAVADRTGAAFVQADARDPDAIRRSVAEATSRLGGLDAVVLNAGILHPSALSETSDESWDVVMETNLLAPYRYAVACLPALRSAGGSITLVSSDAGIWPEVAIGAYSVSKRALVWLGRMLAVEGGPHGVRTNVVCPGDTAPGMATFVEGRVEPEPGEASGWLAPPLGRVGTGADVAATVAFFVSADSSFCNGAVLLVDGGMRASLRSSEVMNP
jgi:meso-butanediol dehydrogenase / (S,S)-butanediol dehydrogenase / diacetyl reductase